MNKPPIPLKNKLWQETRDSVSDVVWKNAIHPLVWNAAWRDIHKEVQGVLAAVRLKILHDIDLR